MDIEKKEQLKEIKKLGNIEVERTLDGKILRINDITLQEGDKVLVIQRHQKPGPFNKEQLLKSPPEGMKELSSLDYTYEPEATEEGTNREQKLLSESMTALGKMDLIATTPRKRGSQHKKLLSEQFPDAKKDESIDKLLDDSGLGLMGESFYGAYDYTLEEARKLFKPNLTKELKFGRGTKEEKKPFSYMETWIKLGYLKPGNKWKVENPEELTERTKKLLDEIQEKNYFITHEANCVTFHMLAEKSTDELRELLSQIDIPNETRDNIENKLSKAANIFDLFKLVKQSLIENPIKGYHYKKILTSFLEKIKLKSDKKGYGALSIHVLREDEKGKKRLLEAAYDEQI